MVNHIEVLNKINQIQKFFESIGLKLINDLPDDWDLDSCYKFVPKETNFKIRWNGDDRILLSVNVFLVGGIHFMVSGKMWSSVSETIQTDYDFKVKYHNATLLSEYLRDWKIKQLV